MAQCTITISDVVSGTEEQVKVAVLFDPPLPDEEVPEEEESTAQLLGMFVVDALERQLSSAMVETGAVRSH